MPIFAVIQQDSGAELLEKLRKHFPNDLYPLSNRVWLVSAPGIARELSDRIGLTSGEAGSALVVEVASYFGRADPAIWSWFKTNWEKFNG